ncbi:MAG: hypothetical protein LBV69_07740 [Bacteroidales bacterium]|jgi:hypothetical protein|nr:hypothetical protein [Bacteroidales bacterium]
MKKYIILCLVASMFIVTLFSSCKKNVTCECTTHYSGTSAEYMPDVVTQFIAEDGDCKAGNSTTSTAGITITVKCVEK